MRATVKVGRRRHQGTLHVVVFRIFLALESTQTAFFRFFRTLKGCFGPIDSAYLTCLAWRQQRHVMPWC